MLTGALLLAGCGGGHEATPPAAEVAETSPPKLEATSTSTSASPNSAPIIDSLELVPATPLPDQSVGVMASSRDVDGDAVRLAYEWSLNGAAVRGGSDRLRFPQARKGDVLGLRVVATDSRGAQSVRELQATMGNRAPELSAVRIDPEGSVERGSVLTARPVARDIDRDPISARFEWRVNGRSRPGEGEQFATDGLRRGDSVQAFAIVSDGESESEQVASSLVEIGNSPPQIVSQPGSASPDGRFYYQVRASDPDLDRGLIFRLDQAPEGMSITRTSGELVWQPRADQAGQYQVVIVVDDRNGGTSSQTFEISLAGDAPPAGRAVDPF